MSCPSRLRRSLDAWLCSSFTLETNQSQGFAAWRTLTLTPPDSYHVDRRSYQAPNCQGAGNGSHHWATTPPSGWFWLWQQSFFFCFCFFSLCTQCIIIITDYKRCWTHNICCVVFFAGIPFLLSLPHSGANSCRQNKDNLTIKQKNIQIQYLFMYAVLKCYFRSSKAILAIAENSKLAFVCAYLSKLRMNESNSWH